jgi:hypothetical protein
LPDYSKALVVSSPGSKKLAPLTRDKLFLSIYKSLGHRPDALDSSTALTTTIIGRLLTKNKPFQGSALENKKDVLIYVHNIAVISYEVLRRFDPSAAAIYKTYHKEALRD